ncbi:MAG: hypothetical protein CMJ81_10355 [Planctomycetaceae bacterium]|nr:hypothetical protein [Planctomycetaceae bacterium]
MAAKAQSAENTSAAGGLLPGLTVSHFPSGGLNRCGDRFRNLPPHALPQPASGACHVGPLAAFADIDNTSALA